jgi:TetR/AcrR family transcriptional repressor of nem operon
MNVKAPTKWQQKREASRAALLQAAMRRFHDHGYAATTVAEIAADAGYTSGAFYFHFKDKTECFWAVVEHREVLRGAWWEGVLEGLDPATTPLEEVLARTFAHFSESVGSLNAWVLVMVDFHQQHRGDADAAARLAEVYDLWREDLTRFVAALAEGGWIGADRDPATVATQIFAFGEGMNAHAAVYGLDEAAARAATIAGLVRLLR